MYFGQRFLSNICFGNSFFTFIFLLFQWSLLMRATFSFWWKMKRFAGGRLAFNIKPARSSVITVPDDSLLSFSHSCIIFYFTFRPMIHFESFLPTIWDVKFSFSFIFVAYRYLHVLALWDEKDHYSCIELYSELHKKKSVRPRHASACILCLLACCSFGPPNINSRCVSDSFTCS